MTQPPLAQQPPTRDIRRRAGWLPATQEHLEAWLAGHSERAAANADAPLHPSVDAFRALIDTDPVVAMHVRRMIDEVPSNRSYTKRHLQSPEQLLRLVNEVLTVAPEYGDEAVTLPLGAILDWTMGTTAGFAAYRDPRINQCLQAILRAWCEFLDSPESLYVLHAGPRGWKSEQAIADVGMDQFVHDPDDRHWGFTSWNDFFTRRFVDGARPVAAPEDDKVIVSACESTPYNLQVGVRREDSFWVKGQPYSLQQLLAADAAVEEFVGGSVYQAFLSATDYHRWHSPVAGTIVRAFVVDGTYYSEADSEGSDAAEPVYSQGYLAHVAARAIVLIEADDPVIGLMAFLAVGMSDVSSCLFAEGIEPGAHVGKGEELGEFQFGGSTHCLVFRPGVIASFAEQAQPRPHDAHPPIVRLGTPIATAR